MKKEKWTSNFDSLERDYDFEIDKTIIGLPGTGKTFTLQKEVMQELVDFGYEFDEIAVSTFSKSMAKEFQNRAEDEFAVFDKFDWFDSTHALCLKLVGAEKQSGFDIVNKKLKEKFCDTHGYGFNIQAEYDNSNTADEELGNALFDMRMLCLKCLKDPVDDWKWAYREINPDVRVSSRVVEQFNSDFEEWKNKNGNVSFVDMIKIALDKELVPPVNVLIEDEFQDKSPLELRLFEMWSQNIDEVYVAGDPFQAIYSFKGSEPSIMIEAYRQSSEKQVLDTTYRFGEDLWNFSENILQSRGYDTPDLECAGDTEVERISWTAYRRKVAELQEEECFHLVRSRHLTDDVGDILRKAGVISRFDFNEDRTVPYENYFEAVKNAVDLADSVRGSIRGLSDFHLDLQDVEYLVYMAPDSVFCENKRKLLRTIETKEDTGTDLDLSNVFDSKRFVEVFTSDNPFHEMNEKRFKKWYKHKSTMASAYKNDEDLSKHISHDVATVHKSKGKDADYVFLLNGSTSTIKREGSEREEARVFFVGATRAAEKLYVVDTPEKHKFKMSSPKKVVN